MDGSDGVIDDMLSVCSRPGSSDDNGCDDNGNDMDRQPEKKKAGTIILLLGVEIQTDRVTKTF